MFIGTRVLQGNCHPPLVPFSFPSHFYSSSEHSSTSPRQARANSSQPTSSLRHIAVTVTVPIRTVANAAAIQHATIATAATSSITISPLYSSQCRRCPIHNHRHRHLIHHPVTIAPSSSSSSGNGEVEATTATATRPLSQRTTATTSTDSRKMCALASQLCCRCQSATTNFIPSSGAVRRRSATTGCTCLGLTAAPTPSVGDYQFLPFVRCDTLTHCRHSQAHMPLLTIYIDLKCSCLSMSGRVMGL